MRFISTKVHGILDYLYVLLLFIVPNVFHYNINSAATYTSDIVASAVLIYSLFTKYELGVFKSIPMRYHLIFDFIVGAMLAVSPWLFGFADHPYAHLFFGIFAIVAALLSKTSSETIKKSTYTPGK